MDPVGPIDGPGGGGLGQPPSGKGVGGGSLTKPALHVVSRVQTANPHDLDAVGSKKLAQGSDGCGSQLPLGQFFALLRRRQYPVFSGSGFVPFAQSCKFPRTPMQPS